MADGCKVVEFAYLCRILAMQQLAVGIDNHIKYRTHGGSVTVTGVFHSV